jgi:hypothetical protein
MATAMETSNLTLISFICRFQGLRSLILKLMIFLPGFNMSTVLCVNNVITWTPALNASLPLCLAAG